MARCANNNCPCNNHNNCGDENCCKPPVNNCDRVEDDYENEYECDACDEVVHQKVSNTKDYPHTNKDALPSDIKVQELFNIFDYALYKAFNEYKPTYGEMFLAVFQLQQKLYTLYMRDIARSNMALMRMEMVSMMNHAENKGCNKLNIYT